MRNRAAILAGLLAFVPAGFAAGGPERFRPADGDYVVLQLPTMQVDEPQPRDAREVQHVASRYIELARSTREQRYYGRAEAVLKPWLERADTPPSLLHLQADILQNRHDFPGALRLLDRAVELDPRLPRPKLLRATVLMVRGDPASARSDCAALIGIGETALGTVCLAQSLAGSGQLQRASMMTEILLTHDGISEQKTRAWAHISLADFASRRSDLIAAEQHLRAALIDAPEDEFIRCALSDILIARGAAQEALKLLDLPRPSAGLLVRQAIANTVLGDIGARDEALTQFEELLNLESQRGERVHLREETLLALALHRPQAQVLQLAKENFAVQREPIDARLLARAATAARDLRALDELREWQRNTGFSDHFVDMLVQGS